MVHKHFNSQPREGGWLLSFEDRKAGGVFQLTAARRRLATVATLARWHWAYFNSQPREGGWYWPKIGWLWIDVFQLTAARRRLVPPLKPLTRKACIALFR